ncbi:MAG: hypothetical protein FWD58_08270 [Firmicutes bacterium]|nr:hypothetical protein [Bacillota bacterium]
MSADQFIPAKHFRKPIGLYRYFPLTKKIETVAVVLSVAATALAVVFVILFSQVPDAEKPGNWPLPALAAAFTVVAIFLGPAALFLSKRSFKRSEAVLAAIENTAQSGKRLMSFDDILSASRIVNSKRELLDILARLFFIKALQTVWINEKQELLEKVK